MLKYTDEEIARQLEELGNTITTGINSARDVLQQAQQIENSVLEVQRTVGEKASQIEARESEIGEMTEKITQMREQIEQMLQQVESAVNEVGGKQGLQALRQQYQAEITILRKTQQRQFFWLLALTFGVAMAAVSAIIIRP
ncbi:MAG: hypothetical protein QNJ63_02185 [Calothrix sp. MO_192.B10]|nr:hypothetical protein [Calothrix sp. MO_192.B10]